METRLALAASAAVLLLACSSTEPAPLGNHSSALPPDAGGSCGLYAVPAKTDSATVVSLKTDVSPIFSQSCATMKACHAAGGDRAFLAGEPGAVRTAIVNVASVQLASMPLVTPGDPAKSYLMHKMDGDQCYFDLSCLGGFCQGSMPSSAPLLSVDMTGAPGARDIIRRWILQGAKDN